MKKKFGSRLALLALCLALACAAAPTAARAAEEEKTVRVGWYESTFCYRDQFGRRCGIAYEYQQRIAVHTGWRYEYVEDSWPNLFEMLKNGEIDLLSDVSLTEERTAYMSFPELPMGSELYYIYIDGDNEEITADDPHSFDGKRIGANKGSVQARCLRAWAEEHGVTPEIVELTAEEGESMDMLARGELDGYASTNSFGAKERIVPVCRIGSSDFFFAVNRQRPDLLNELNRAMNGILEEDPYFNQKMYDEYIYITGTEAFLTREQEHWLDAHGTIRIGYRDDYLPFCAQDKTTGELTGALRDYLSHAENLLKNAALSVQAVPFHTTAEAMDALRSGEIDCVFPVNLDTYDAELLDVLTTNPVAFTEMYAVLRKTDQRSVSRSRNSRVAVAAGNINTETFIKDKSPDWYVTYYADDEACMNAVASEQEDCMLRTSYRTTAAEGLLTRYRLHWLPTGETMGFSFAVGRSGRTLCFILNKTIAMTRSEDMDAALTSYMHFGERVSFSRFLSDNWPAALLCVTVMFGVILVLLFEKAQGGALGERTDAAHQRRAHQAPAQAGGDAAARADPAEAAGLGDAADLHRPAHRPQEQARLH